MDYTIEINFFDLTLTASSNHFYKLAEIQEFVETMQEEEHELFDFDDQDEDFEEDFEEDEFDDEEDWSDVEYCEEGYAWWFDDEDEVWYIYDELNEEWVEFEDDEEKDECEED